MQTKIARKHAQLQAAHGDGFFGHACMRLGSGLMKAQVADGGIKSS